MVLKVVVISEDGIMITGKGLHNTFVLRQRQMRKGETVVFKHHFFREIHHCVDGKPFGKESAEDIPKNMVDSAGQCYFFHN